nr:Uncharacterised protein [Salmonella sp. NCTC 7297]
MRSIRLNDRLVPRFIVASQFSAQFRHVQHQKIRITLRQVLAPFGLASSVAVSAVWFENGRARIAYR